MYTFVQHSFQHCCYDHGDTMTVPSFPDDIVTQQKKRRHCRFLNHLHIKYQTTPMMIKVKSCSHFCDSCNKTDCFQNKSIVFALHSLHKDLCEKSMPQHIDATSDGDAHEAQTGLNNDNPQNPEGN